MFLRCLLGLMLSGWALSAEPPNIVMFAVDDLNDWVGCLGGHPQVRTPNLDRLAARGVLFTNAHCVSPLCGPSRTAVFTGLPPHETGIYDNAVWFRQVERLQSHPSLPQALAARGYKTIGMGKLFHTTVEDGMPKSEFQHTAKRGWENYGPFPDQPFNYHDKVFRLRDWAAWPPTDEENADHVIASRAVTFLREKRQQPFFLAIGFFRPHAPFYASPKWHELYPREGLKMPPVQADDLADVPMSGQTIMTRSFDPEWVREHGKAAEIVQAYLAAVSFVDAQIGRVLDALEASPQRDNTVVVLWSDHGFHLGEKNHFGKTTLWERASRVPLIIAGPGIPAKVTCAQPVSLLDLYPTLLALGGCEPRPELSGRNLLPLLRAPGSTRLDPVVITYRQGNHAVRGERWRYLRYQDGSEELYDLANDPNEWTNLASRAEHAEVLQEQRRWLPKASVAPARRLGKPKP